MNKLCCCVEPDLPDISVNVNCACCESRVQERKAKDTTDLNMVENTEEKEEDSVKDKHEGEVKNESEGDTTYCCCCFHRRKHHAKSKKDKKKRTHHGANS